MGQNIGTCVTAMLSSVGAKRNAKTAAIMHLLFNIIGTVLFTILCSTTQITDWVASWTVGNSVAQIANMHTLFNIVTTLILLPFAGLLAKAAFKILPGKSNEEGEMHLTYIGVGDAAVGSTVSYTHLDVYKRQFLYRS